MTEFPAEIKALINRRLEEAERNLQAIRDILAGKEQAQVKIHAEVDSEAEQQGERVIFGTFDGQNMRTDDGQTYPVPANYASKSKLVEGDKLKLTIDASGAFIYKQIGPVERQRVIGVLALNKDGDYVVRVGEKEYKVLLASVTYYKIEPGDEVTILLPHGREAKWGAVENVIRSQGTEEEAAASEAEEK